MVRTPVLALALTLAVNASADPGPRDDTKKHYTAVRTDCPPTIDGRLDDGAWQAAPADSRFTQNFPDEGRPPSQKTELRVLYDDQALYIGVRAWDSDAKAIVQRLSRRDHDTDADKIDVDIDSRDDHSTGYHFEINSAGVLLDGVRFNDTDYSQDWDGLWLGAASRDDKGWSAELKIPLKTLRYEAHPGRTWFGFEVRRIIQRRQEVDEWAYVPRSARGEVSRYGVLDGLHGLRTRRLFQIVPYVAGGLYLRYAQPPVDGATLYGNVGVDLKVGLTPALTLDATINPDFGQVEADQVVLNLTTFEVFYPEKRPFFLEGVDIFNTPLPLFYSRRIGHAPPAPNNYTLEEPLPNGRIWAATKISGLVAPRLTIGVLDAVTDSAEVAVTPANGGAARAIGIEPLANYAVVRLRRDIFTRSTIGLLGTAVNRFEPAFFEAPLPGDICPDEAAVLSGITPAPHSGRCTHDAYTGGIDANLVTANGNWGVRAQAAGSVIGGGPRRLVPDGTSIGPGDAGAAFHVDGGKQAGHLILTGRYEGASPKLDFNDAGYSRQANLHFINPEVGWRIIKPTSIFLEGNIFSGSNTRLTWDGASLLQQQLYLTAWLRFRNNWTLWTGLFWDADHTDVRETRDGAKLERVGGWGWGFNLRTDSRKRVVLSLNGFENRVQHGQSWDAATTLSLRPIPAVELDVTPHVNFTYGDPRWFDTVYGANGARTYYLAELDSRDFDVTLRGTYTFTPTLTLQAYAQLFLDSGHYGATSAATADRAFASLPFSAFHQTVMPADQNPDFRDGTINVNVVLRWEFVPGSTLLGVYTHSSAQLPYDATSEGSGQLRITRFTGGPGTDLFLLKLSLLLS